MGSKLELGSKLALLGGPKAVHSDLGTIFSFYPPHKNVENAVLDVLRAGKMSGLGITMEFEKEFAKWLGVKYAVASNTGTSALQTAMYGAGVGHGDEMIVQGWGYWATCLQVYSLGGTPVFTEIDPERLTIDPNDIEHRISPRTKAIMVVHWFGMPADMHPIMDIAKRHKIKVIEDVSHAQGAFYKGRMVGSIGDVAGFSLMTGKPLHIGEGGMMATNDRRIFERAVAFGDYMRHPTFNWEFEDLKAGANMPLGGYKYRMSQLSSAMGRIQLKDYPKLVEEMDKAMNYFWDSLEGVPGIKPHRPLKREKGTTKNWYAAVGLYRPEELDGLSIYRFTEAVSAEGARCGTVFWQHGGNGGLHTHPLFNTIDVYNQGKPTRIANLPPGLDIRQPPGSLPITENIRERVFTVPWFKYCRSKIIDEYINAFKKVAENYAELLPGDTEEYKKRSAQVAWSPEVQRLRDYAAP